MCLDYFRKNIPSWFHFVQYFIILHFSVVDCLMASLWPWKTSALYSHQDSFSSGMIEWISLPGANSKSLAKKLTMVLYTVVKILSLSLGWSVLWWWRNSERAWIKTPNLLQEKWHELSHTWICLSGIWTCIRGTVICKSML